MIPITLPPLRDRREDIPLLARHFVQKSCKSNNLPPRRRSTQDAVRALMNYSWPGNIRQLENAIEHAVAMSGPEREVPARAARGRHRAGRSLLMPTVAIPDEGINFPSVVSQLERELILRCLEKTGGNKRQAARLLQLSRTTFIDKLHRLNIATASEPPEPAAH